MRLTILWYPIPWLAAPRFAPERLRRGLHAFRRYAAILTFITLIYNHVFPLILHSLRRYAAVIATRSGCFFWSEFPADGTEYKTDMIEKCPGCAVMCRHDAVTLAQ